MRMQRLRLNPTIQTVWASPTLFRFGIHESYVTLDNPPPRIERLIDALRAGMPVERYPQIASALGVTRSEQAALLSALAPVLENPSSQQPEPARGSQITLAGEEALHPAFTTALVHGGFVLTNSPVAEAAVTTSHFVTPLVQAREWATRGIAHLPVVFNEREIVIGPFVGVEENPCVFCVELHRADRDPAWAAIASQCLGRTAATATPALTTITAGFVLSILKRWQRTSNALPGTQLVLTADEMLGVSVTTRPISFHPKCDCHAFAS